MSVKSKILVIDDDEDFQISVRSILESNGYEVVEAYSGKDGLQKLVEHKPDLVVLDIMMESTSEGYGVNHAIKFWDKYKEYRKIPIVMVSAIEKRPDELFPLASNLGMITPNRYLVKPLDIPRFLEILEELTG